MPNLKKGVINHRAIPSFLWINVCCLIRHWSLRGYKKFVVWFLVIFSQRNCYILYSNQWPCINKVLIGVAFQYFDVTTYTTPSVEWKFIPGEHILIHTYIDNYNTIWFYFAFIAFIFSYILLIYYQVKFCSCNISRRLYTFLEGWVTNSEIDNTFQ